LGSPSAKAKSSLNHKFGFGFGSEIQSLFFSGGVFPNQRFVWFSASKFWHSPLRASSWLFVQQVSFSSAKFRVYFVESLKLASRFLGQVLVSKGFDWLCFVALVLFVVGFVGSQNWLVFFLQKFWQVEFVKLSRLRWLCQSFAKVGFFKICALVVCGFDWQSQFL
jgi:hypothetical protein